MNRHMVVSVRGVVSGFIFLLIIIIMWSACWHCRYLVPLQLHIWIISLSPIPHLAWIPTFKGSLWAMCNMHVMFCFDDLLDEWKSVLRSDTSFGVLWCCSLVTFIALAIGLVSIQNIEVQYYWPHNIATLLNTETFHFWTYTHTHTHTHTISISLFKTNNMHWHA